MDSSRKSSDDADLITSDDPWYWSVRKVVALLCDRKGRFWRSVDPVSIPDLVFLERTLRANVVNGATLLTGLSYATLREDLEIKPLGHRTHILHQIRNLQRQSVKYVHYVQSDPSHSYVSSYDGMSGVQGSQLMTPHFGSPFQHVPCKISAVSGVTKFPIITSGNEQQTSLLAEEKPLEGLGLLQSEGASLHSNQFTGTSKAVNDIGNTIDLVPSITQNTLAELDSNPNSTMNIADPSDKSDPTAVNNIRQGESFIFDNGKKRRRLILTTPALAREPELAKITSSVVHGLATSSALLNEPDRIHEQTEDSEERIEGRPRSSSKLEKSKLSDEDVKEAIELARKEITERWKRVIEPRLRRNAWRIWMEPLKDPNNLQQITFLTETVKNLEIRLLKIVEQIQGEHWSTVKEIRKQCQSLEQSQYSLEECKWRMSVLQLEVAPEKPPPQQRKAAEAGNFARTSEQTDNDLDSRAGEREDSDNSLNDFVINDDSETVFYTAPDEDNLSRSQVEGDEMSRSKTPGMRLETPGKNSKTPGMQPKPLDTHNQAGMEFSDTNNKNDEAKVESVKNRAVAHKARKSVAKSPLSQRESAGPASGHPDIIDLTHLFDSSGQETQVEVPYTLSTIRTPQLSFLKVEEDPLSSDQGRTAVFKNPPVLSNLPPVVNFEGVTSSGNNATKSNLLSSPESLPRLNRIDEIRLMDESLLVERKDRNGLLLWTIASTRLDQRQKVADYIDQTAFDVIRPFVWKGLKAYKTQSLEISGMKIEDSDTMMRIAAWFICWTIPVKVSARLPGMKLEHITAALSDTKGFKIFYAILREHLDFCRVERDGQLTTMPAKRALLEDSDISVQSKPHKKQRKYAVPEKERTVRLRHNTQQRVNDRNKREEQLHRSLQARGINAEDAQQVIVNPGKHDDQEFIYLNPAIGGRIQHHQQDGVQFMWREVIAAQQGCLLAQTMGLGKTMQVITLLVTVAEAARSSSENIRIQVPKELHESRTLILCPVGLIENWWDEFLKWTPILLSKNIGRIRKVTAAFQMKERLHEIEAWNKNGGVLIMGYNTFRDFLQNNARKNGVKQLNDEQYEMVSNALLEFPNIVVADEAHAAKKPTSGINKTMNQLRTMHRIALTGSPLANNLEEYYSLIDWIAPDYLGTPASFKAHYQGPIQEGLWQNSSDAQYRGSLSRLEVLKQELEPKVHRADISALAGRLKPKQEFVIRVPLTPLQEELYSICIDSVAIAADSAEKTTSTLWALLAVLRLLCNHPQCYKNKLIARAEKSSNGTAIGRIPLSGNLAALDVENALVDASLSEIGMSQAQIQRQLDPFMALTEPSDSPSHSNKIMVLEAIIQFSRDAQDKILIFSHTLETLNYIELLLQKKQVRYSRIDGEVKPTHRQQLTKDFNQGDTEVCIISTRSGGQGLNLFGANRVVIMDDHYNPMYEEQAVGRAYRIGQLKPVFVYYLMVGGTFEEIIHNQSVFKLQLATRVVDKKNPARRALRGISEYLLPPKTLEQQDLQEFYGNDDRVLDRILDLQAENPIIRSIDYTDTFSEEDKIILTIDEQREADQLRKDEQLRRSDPKNHELQMRRRREDQLRVIDPATIPMMSSAPAQDPNEIFLNYQFSHMSAPPRTHHSHDLQVGLKHPMAGKRLNPRRPKISQ